MEVCVIHLGLKMGSDTGDQDERPVHQVTISKAIKKINMGKYEVTQGQWQAVDGFNPSASPGDANRPVESGVVNEARRSSVSSRHEGVQRYRLPTKPNGSTLPCWLDHHLTAWQ